jgi:hypothetical protein
MLDDVNRRAQLEGFETQFELRIPRGYEEGAYVHSWQAGDPVRLPVRKPDPPMRQVAGETTR